MAKQKILLIQSTETQGNGTKRFLEERGYKVIWARSGLTALMMATNMAIDVIVLDVALPDIEGLDLCRRFRQRSDTRSIPIMLLTSRGYAPEQAKRTAFGPDDYLAKPYSGSELDNRISALLDAGMPEAAGSGTPAPSEQPLAPEAPKKPLLYAESILLPEPRRAMITVAQQAQQQDVMLGASGDTRPRQEPVLGAEPEEDRLHKTDLRAGSQPAAASEKKEEASAQPASDAPPSLPLLPVPATGDVVIDPATGLFGRPQFEAMFAKEFKRATRFKQQMSCMLIDLDGTKVGRRAEAGLVTSIIGLVQKTIREIDTAAWWTGETLIVLLPNTIRHDALQAAARILEAVAIHPFTWPDATNVTMSIGVAGLPDPHIDTEEKLLEAAEAARSRAQDLMVPSPDHKSFLKKR